MTYVDALQTALAAEHAAVFVVGYLGAQTSESATPQLYAAFRDTLDTHRDRRDRLATLLRDAGADPVAAAASYELPQVVTNDVDSLQAAGVAIERACGATYGFLVASTPADRRAWAVQAVLDSALRELDLGGDPRPFPGR